MTKKRAKTKKAGSSRKAPKVDAAVPATWPESRPRKASARDPRLPAVGETLTREYKGKEYRVTVLEDGFRHDGKEWRSLTAIARAVTGYPAISGPAWFGIAEGTKATQKAPKSKRKVDAPKQDTPPAAPTQETATA